MTAGGRRVGAGRPAGSKSKVRRDVRERLRAFLEDNVEDMVRELRNDKDARVRLELLRLALDRVLGKVGTDLHVSGTLTLEGASHRRAIERTSVTVEATPLLEAPRPAIVSAPEAGGSLPTPDYGLVNTGSEDGLEGPEETRLDAERTQKEAVIAGESGPAVGSKPRNAGSTDV